MSFLLDPPASSLGPQEIVEVFAKYSEYLDSIRNALPQFAYEFAVAPWHYNARDHRSPHDSWVESLTISEPATGSRHENRHLEIAVRLLGAYHDGYLELSYPEVQSYSFIGASHAAENAGHGDWLVDELRLSERGLVLHEILFRSGSRWLIEAKDIRVTWEQN